MKLKKILAILFISVNFLCYSQKVELYKQFYGSYDFTMLGNTMNTKANGDANSCEILTESEAELNLASDKEIVAAYLYWAGIGGKKEADLKVKLNGTEVISSRTNHLIIDTSQDAGYFSAFADVTSIVKKEGSGTFLLSDLDLRKHLPRYCGGEFVGWSMVIVYKDMNIENNLVGIYDGLEMLDGAQNPMVNIILDGFRITNAANSKIAFLAWEGDEVIAVGEQLLINDKIVSNGLNPSNNAFNCTNTFSGSTELWNMDLDQYDLSSFVNVNDTSLDIKVTTSQDVILLNTVVLSVYSVFPDATIKLNDYKNYCHQRKIDFDFTVGNYEGNHPLKSNTPISFYINNELVGNTETTAEIAIGSNANYQFTLDIPRKFGYRFDLEVVVDDDGTRNGVVYEIDEENNNSKMPVNLVRDCPIQRGVSANFDGENDAFDLSIYEPVDIKIFNRYGREVYRHGFGYSNQWVGQDKAGGELPAGTYYYVFNTIFETFSGYIYLIKEVR